VTVKNKEETNHKLCVSELCSIIIPRECNFQQSGTLLVLKRKGVEIQTGKCATERAIVSHWATCVSYLCLHKGSLSAKVMHYKIYKLGNT